MDERGREALLKYVLRPPIAQERVGWFGRYETCLLPRPRYRDKFLDEPKNSEPGPPAL